MGVKGLKLPFTFDSELLTQVLNAQVNLIDFLVLYLRNGFLASLYSSRHFAVTQNLILPGHAQYYQLF